MAGRYCSTDDIWKEIIKAGKLLGTYLRPETSADSSPYRHASSSHMRAPMGVKVKDRMETIEKVGYNIENFSREVLPFRQPSAVIADRIRLKTRYQRSTSIVKK